MFLKLTEITKTEKLQTAETHILVNSDHITGVRPFNNGSLILTESFEGLVVKESPAEILHLVSCGRSVW